MLFIDRLCKTYGNGVRALDEVSLQVAKGMFGLLGPNGAGKSSLMRTIATLQPADAGAIRFSDIDVLGEPQRLRQTLGYLPQDFGVYPGISAQRLLEHLSTLKGVPRASVRAVADRLLHLVNLHDVRNKAVSTYSGGMRQRFGIAQALIGDPQLIIVDEPTAGLDPEERHRFHNLLAEIGENVVVILSTHIVDDVADLCQQMAVMAQGRVQSCGVPRVLTERLKGRVWRREIAKHELVRYQQEHRVVTTRLVAGVTTIDVIAPIAPDSAFSAVEPTLEHVYFATLSANASRRTQ